MIKDLDKEFKAAAPGSMIQLESGVYTTIGCNTHVTPDGAVLKLGCSVFGSKEGKTTIICIRPLTEAGGDVSVIRGEGNNTVSNLTVDGGVPYIDQVATPYPRKRNLVFLHGGYNKIISVNGRRQYGIYPVNGQSGRESFGLSAWSEGGSSKIINCSVGEMVGNYSTAIQTNRNGEITDCKLTFPRPINGARNFRAAYNIGDTDGAVVRNCEAWWAMAGIYMDWMDCRNIIVEGCNFIGAEVGLWINAQQTPVVTQSRMISDMVYRNNTVLLDQRAKSIIGVLVDHGHSDGHIEDVTMHAVKDILIQENLFGFVPCDHIASESILAANVHCLTPPEKHTGTLGVDNVRFLNNKVDSRMKFRNHNHNAGASGSVTQKIEFDS